MSFSLSPQTPSFHLSCIERILLLQQCQSEDRNGHKMTCMEFDPLFTAVKWRCPCL
nr:MAG TPA: hypothetical protein [Caudoviricetes sp.]